MGASSSNSLQKSWLVSMLILALSWFWRLCALAYICAFLGYFVPDTLHRAKKDRDAIIYYETAQKVNAGKSLYTPRPKYGPDQKPFDYLYLPPFAAVISPLGKLPWVTFSNLWTIFLTVSYFGFSACVTWLAVRKLHFWTFIGMAMVTGLFLGGNRAFSLGQIDPFLWFIFALGVLAVRARRGKNGLCFGIASLVKIYSIWPLFALPKELVRKSWISAALCLFCGFIGGGFICGFGSYAEWFRYVPPVVGQGTFDPDNFSASMGVLRFALICGWDYTSGPISGFPKLWLTLATAIGPLVAIFLTRKLSPELRVAIVGVVAALCAPICWSSYLPLLLCPAALIIEQNFHRDKTQGTTHALAASA